MLPNNQEKNITETGVQGPSFNTSNTPSRSTRTNRIFKQSSPVRQQRPSPIPEKMLASETTNYNSSRMRSISPSGCTIYYKQGYGLSIPSTSRFTSALSPEKLSLVKSAEVLEYENSLLRKQLQERDDVILMLKKGWSPANAPINDSIIKNLNLRLAQKNVLIQQVHRNLAEFQQIVNKDKVQISPICHERFRILMELIMGHQHYPVLIRERVVQTSKAAERVYIKEESTNVQQWQIKMERSYNELTTLKQKLDWFQRQNQILEGTITGLRGQKQNPNSQEINNYKMQIQKLSNQIIILNQELSSYKQKITYQITSIQQLKRPNQPPMPVQNDTEKDALKTQLNKMQKIIEQKSLEIVYLKSSIETLNRTVSGLKNGQSEFVSRINTLVEELRVEREKQRIQVAKDCGHGAEIDTLNNNIRILNIRIKQIQDQKRINMEESAKWKGHLEQAENYISALLLQLKPFKQGNLKKSQTQLQYKRIDQQNHRLSEEITILVTNMNNLKQQCQSLRTEQKQFNTTVEVYQIKIKDYVSQIEMLMREKNTDKQKWELIINQNNRQHQERVSYLEDKIKQAELWISELMTEIDKFKIGQAHLNEAELKLREYEQIITDLRRQIQGFKSDQDNLRKNEARIREYEATINELRKQIKILQQQVENSKGYQITIKQNQSSILELRKQIETFKKDQENVKRLDNKIKQYQLLTAELKKQIDQLKLELNNFQSKKQQQISRFRSEYEARIASLQQQINSQKSQREWESQMTMIRQSYELKYQQLWHRLSLAEQHIQKQQMFTKSQISELSSSVDRLSIENQNLKRNQEKVKDQYHYKLDQKYLMIQQRLLQLSGKNVRNIEAQSEYWQKYRVQKKKELQEVQGLINEMLVSIGNVEQTVVVRRDQLYRLDLTQLQSVLAEIAQLKNSKSQGNTSVRQTLETKFYGILKTVSTKIPQ